MEQLTVLHDNDSVFSEYSFEAYDFGRDNFVIDLVSADDYLYLGLYKPFNKIYTEFITANTVANEFIAEYYDGTTWSVFTLNDYSKGFTRSGFLCWDRALDDWEATTINSIEKFYIRLKPSADHDITTDLQGLNIVFSDDEDLKEEYEGITDYLLGSNTSFIKYHQAVRKRIVQKLRNEGKAKKGSDDTLLKNVTEWDLLEPQEIREAAKFYCLEKIFDNISDSVEDKEYQLARKYGRMGDDNYAAYLKVDFDDDGVEDASDRAVLNKILIQRR